MRELLSEERLFKAMDATWAPAEITIDGPWKLRRGGGGGKRVSASSTESIVTEQEIVHAEDQMVVMGQPKLFMLNSKNSTLDEMLELRGYRVVDPVLIYCASAADIAKIESVPLDAIPSAEPLNLMKELWQAGGISAERMAVMKRTQQPKTYLFCRARNSPAGAAFVAIDQGIAMLHALEIASDFQRAGSARRVMSRAAIWAIENGAEFLSVVTTSKNLPARGLFSGIGMQIVGKYHYRMK